MKKQGEIDQQKKEYVIENLSSCDPSVN